MKCQLIVRKFTEDDISLDCKFMPDGELEVYANAFVEEMGYIDTVLNISMVEITIDECMIEIITNDLPAKVIKSLISSILSSESFRCKLVDKDFCIIEKQ